MDIKKVNEELRGKAIELGLCNEWQRMWEKDWDQQKMIDRYKKGIDFCMENHYPDTEFMKANFGKEKLRLNNILVDDQYSLLNPKSAVVIGNSKTNIRFNAWSSGEICVGGTSSITITAKNSSFVMVHLYDNAALTAYAYDKARIIVIKHSQKVIIENINGDVRIKTK